MDDFNLECKSNVHGFPDKVSIYKNGKESFGIYVARMEGFYVGGGATLTREEMTKIHNAIGELLKEG